MACDDCSDAVLFRSVVVKLLNRLNVRIWSGEGVCVLYRKGAFIELLNNLAVSTASILLFTYQLAFLS